MKATRNPSNPEGGSTHSSRSRRQRRFAQKMVLLAARCWRHAVALVKERPGFCVSLVIHAALVALVGCTVIRVSIPEPAPIMAELGFVGKEDAPKGKPGASARSIARGLETLRPPEPPVTALMQPSILTTTAVSQFSAPAAPKQTLVALAEIAGKAGAAGARNGTGTEGGRFAGGTGTGGGTNGNGEGTGGGGNGTGNGQGVGSGYPRGEDPIIGQRVAVILNANPYYKETDMGLPPYGAAIAKACQPVAIARAAGLALDTRKHLQFHSSPEERKTWAERHSEFHLDSNGIVSALRLLPKDVEVVFAVGAFYPTGNLYALIGREYGEDKRLGTVEETLQETREALAGRRLYILSLKYPVPELVAQIATESGGGVLGPQEFEKIFHVKFPNVSQIAEWHKHPTWAQEPIELPDPKVLRKAEKPNREVLDIRKPLAQAAIDRALVLYAQKLNGDVQVIKEFNALSAAAKVKRLDTVEGVPLAWIKAHLDAAPSESQWESVPMNLKVPLSLCWETLAQHATRRGQSTTVYGPKGAVVTPGIGSAPAVGNLPLPEAAPEK